MGFSFVLGKFWILPTTSIEWSCGGVSLVVELGFTDACEVVFFVERNSSSVSTVGLITQIISMCI